MSDNPEQQRKDAEELQKEIERLSKRFDIDR